MNYAEEQDLGGSGNAREEAEGDATQPIEEAVIDVHQELDLHMRSSEQSGSPLITGSNEEHYSIAQIKVETDESSPSHEAFDPTTAEFFQTEELNVNLNAELEAHL